MRALLALVMVCSLGGVARAQIREISLTVVRANGSPFASALHARVPASITVSEAETFSMADVVAGRDTPHVGRVWSVVDEHSLRLVFAAASRVVERRVPLENGVDVVVEEQAAEITASVLSALERGELLGVSRVEAEEKFADEMPRQVRAVTARFGVGYTASLLAARTVAHGLAVSGELAVNHDRWRWGASLRAGYAFAVRSDLDEASLSIEAVALRPQVFVSLAASRALRWGLHLGAGVDLLHVRPSSNNEQLVTPEHARFVVDPVATAAASLEVAMGRGFGLAVELGIDVDLVDTRFVAARRADRVAMFDPWRIRPIGSFALTWGGR